MRNLNREPERDEVRHDEPQMRSDGVYHDRAWNGRDTPRGTEGYEPHWDEETQKGKPLEMYHSQNAFTHLSVSATRAGQLTVSGGEKKRPGSPTLSADSSTYRGKRRKRTARPFGEMFTNSHEPGTGAFSFRAQRKTTPRKILQQIGTFRRKNGQETVDRTMPFMTLCEDREKMHRLRDEADGARMNQTGEYSFLTRQKNDAETKIRMKEEMRRRFIKKLVQAQNASGHLTEDIRKPQTPSEAEAATDDGTEENNKGKPSDQNEKKLSENSKNN